MTIDIPDAVRSGDHLCVVSMSGGKDSTALALAMREAGIEHRRVFADTGWEAPETYAYLDTLRAMLGPIDVVAAEGGMVVRARTRAGFPTRAGRWCTQELKVQPLRAYHDAAAASDGRDTISVVGIRAEESEKRAAMSVFEDSDMWGGYVWRPILSWSIADVIAIHHRHGIPLNPLYLRGHDRVGCYPCIFSSKEEVRLIAEHSPERIAEIRDREAEFTRLRAERNAEKPGRYEYDQATFFSPLGDRTTINGIDAVVEWSRTAHGGRKLFLPMLAPPPEGGCFRWGMCEPPPVERKDGGA